MKGLNKINSYSIWANCLSCNALNELSIPVKINLQHINRWSSEVGYECGYCQFQNNLVSTSYIDGLNELSHRGKVTIDREKLKFSNIQIKGKINKLPNHLHQIERVFSKILCFFNLFKRTYWEDKCRICGKVDYSKNQEDVAFQNMIDIMP